MKNVIILVFGIFFTLSLLAQATPEEKTTIPEINPNKSAEDLNKAYQKEYAFLTAQIKSIKTRTQDYIKSSTKEKKSLSKQINNLESKLLDLDNQINQIEDDIFTLQRNSESASDNNNLIESTITQAKSTMSEYDFEGFTDESNIKDINKIESLILFAIKIVEKYSSVSKEEGSFFLQNGQEVKGEIIKIGNIASYGHSQQGSGALAPAGENKFKVWRNEDSTIVAEIFNGKTQDSLPIFLYESSIKSIVQKKKKTIRSVIESGGIIAWIIVFLGLFALILIVLRIWFLRKSSSSTEKILKKIVHNIESDDMEHAMRIASHKHSSSGRVMYAVLRNISRDREHIEDIVSESILHESGQLNRFGSLIMVVATVSPLLGLLGTVTGMISTFDIITEFGTGDPKLLSEGISIALVTTEVGLAVAIPALVFGNVLSGWAERIKDDMEKAALRVINVYKKLQE